MNSVPQTQRKSNSRRLRFCQTIIILSNGEWVYVPNGVDPDDCRRQHEARLNAAAMTTPAMVAA